MITKFIGSLSDFKECSKIALVNTNGSVLNESDIPLYTISYITSNFEFNDSKWAMRKWWSESEKENSEKYPYYYTYKFDTNNRFVLDALIIYSETNVPLGFTMLNYKVNANELKLNQLDINLDFVITIDERFLNIEFISNYEDHYNETESAHKNLLGVKAITKSQFERLPNRTKSIFSNTIRNNKIYRYSGNLIDGTVGDKGGFINSHSFTDLQFSITDNSDIFAIGDDYYLLSANGNRIDWKCTNGTGGSYTFSDTVLSIGKNVILVGNSNSYSVVSTRSLLNNNQIVLSKSSYKYVKDLVTKELYFYQWDGTNGASPISNELKDLFDRLRFKNLNDVIELVGVGPNIIVYRSRSNGGKLVIINDEGYPTSETGIVPVDNQIYYDNSKSLYNESYLKYRTYKEYEIKDIKNQFYPFEVNELWIISSRCLLVKRSNGNWYTIEFKSSPTGPSPNQSTNSYCLGTTNNWRRLDKFSKHQFNPTKLNLLMRPYRGRLYKINGNTVSVL